jgi:serine/threonine-protein kinase
MRRPALFLLLLAVPVPTGRLGAAEPDELAAKVKTILETNCHRCHGKDGSGEGGFDYVLNMKTLVERRKVVPGEPKRSPLFWRVTSAIDPMPPEDEKPRPSKDDIAALENWIRAGAPDFPPVVEPADLAAKARAVLNKHCFPCHGQDGKRSGGFGYALDVKKMIEKGKVVPGKLDAGLIARVTAADDADVMPPPGRKPRPTPEEIEDLKKWILAGAVAFEVPRTVSKPRPFLTERDTYRAMYDFLSKHHDQACYKRFLTLTHLHNDSAVSEATLRLYHAGVSKLLNSLSWRRNIILPRIVDQHGAVLAFDLRDLDWDVGGQWRLLLNRRGKHPGYPYALTHEHYPEDAELRELAARVYELSDTRIPAVRADWFLAAASLPPLYHELLHLPDNAGELERRLGVNVARNFERDYLARAGLGESGVAARANRLLERHEAVFGAYWKSYDFGSNANRGSLSRFPLGPLNLFPPGRHPFEDRAFEHAGGELIWNLPNGLQAYLLVDGAGKRLDEAPAIVRDEKETAGRGTTIVNGLSCMACHKHGMMADFKETVRAGATLEGREKEKVLRLYPEKRELDRLMKKDRDLFLASLGAAIGPLVRVGDDEKKALEQFAEPVSALASPYLKGNLTLEQAARELGLKDPQELAAAIRNNPTLRIRLALNDLAQGNTIRREFWESLGPGDQSIFQSAAEELKRGSVRVQKEQP